MAASSNKQQQNVNPLAATHDWVLVVPAKGKKHFEWVPKYVPEKK